ncbi:MAG: tRNA-binding protein [Parcubacteria group bacterium]|nr:tRNA-binding protein [Parcubacteria group bacterium]
MEKVTAEFKNFEALDIRVGKIVNVEDTETKKPTYKVTIDFGGEVGTKVSCAGYRSYAKEDLLGKLIIAVVNLPPKQVGPETSEVLILGVSDKDDKAVYLTPQSEVSLGSKVF